MGKLQACNSLVNNSQVGSLIYYDCYESGYRYCAGLVLEEIDICPKSGDKFCPPVLVILQADGLISDYSKDDVIYLRG